ncbi:hypothetical protein HDU97_009994 [Phlyctochytrium planicorne]|nr:hypothetical protein HDU97_009994 [Phlyctochytrium planicorne]
MTAGVMAVFVSTSTSICGHIVATILFPPEENLTPAKRILHALMQTTVACLASLFTTSLYPITLAASSFPDTFAWGIVKSIIYNFVSTISTETLRKYLEIIRNYKQKSMQKLHNQHQDQTPLPCGIRLEVVQLSQDPDILDFEEAHELAFANSPHFMVPFYKLPSNFIILKSSNDSFHFNVVLNIIIDVVFRAVVTRNRRRREIEKLQAIVKDEETGPSKSEKEEMDVYRHSTISPKIIGRIKRNSTIANEFQTSGTQKRRICNLQVLQQHKRNYLLRKNILLTEAVRSIAELTGGYVAIAVTWLVAFVFLAVNALYPPNESDRCSAGNLNQLDFTYRSLEMIALRIPADMLFLYFGSENGLPYHLVKIRFSLAMHFSIAMFGAQHIVMFLVAYRGQAVDYNQYARACIPKNIFPSYW